jgi:NADH pyrophosphatase NudC (nudix superfamily)
MQKSQLQKNSRQAKYIKEKCEKLSLTLPKGTKAKWSAYTAAKGEPLATFIRRFMNESIEKDNFASEKEHENHGKWTTDKVAFMKICSLCYESVDFSHNYNFCPNCGAKMDLKEF